MPADIARLGLLKQLRDLRSVNPRFSASIIATYAVNLPFYEHVVLRYLQSAGCRFNVVLADAQQLSHALVAESTRPRRAGIDYILVPVSGDGAFHPKILVLLSDRGSAIAIGSQNLTEAGFGRNGEVCASFGFGREAAPGNLSRAVTDYLLECAGNLTPGDDGLGKRVSDRLRAMSLHGSDANDDATFVGASPGGDALIDQALPESVLKNARRILVVGPYFDDKLGFLRELQRRAPKAAVAVAVQPNHAVIKRPDRLPPRSRWHDADALKIRKTQPFLHAKSIVVEGGKQTILAIGSANPSAPAWLANAMRRNHEAMVVIRGDEADRLAKALGLTRLWDAPVLGRRQLDQIAERSASEVEEVPPGKSVLAGLWNQGVVEALIGQTPAGSIRSISILSEAQAGPVSLTGATVDNGRLRFTSPVAGVFEVQFGTKTAPVFVIASSAAAMAPALVSGTTARLIDELARLDGGGLPGEELIDLCEKVMLGAHTDEQARPGEKRRRAREEEAPGTPQGPRGIGVSEENKKARARHALDLDISAIITLLLKELADPARDTTDPTSDDDEDEFDPRLDTELDIGVTPRTWNDIAHAVGRRVRQLLNRLSARVSESAPPRWKYERVLISLALMKRLRRFHPDGRIPVVGVPERLVDNDDVRVAFKLAMRCWFARDSGVLEQLQRAGGIEGDHEVTGRVLLLWAAFESGVDAALPTSSRLDPDEVRAIQSDRMDAIVAAMAAAATPEILDRARRELLDNGAWHTPRNRTDAVTKWLERHEKIGLSLLRLVRSDRTSKAPIFDRAPSMRDILFWTNEMGWPRLPHAITGNVVHLADVGDSAPIRIQRRFVRVLDLDAIGIRSLVAGAGA